MKNMVANETLTAAFQSAGGASSDLTVEQVAISNADANDAVESVCGSINEFFGVSGPDLLLDTTTAGKAGEAVRSIAKTLGIPTVSMAYGDKDDMG